MAGHQTITPNVNIPNSKRAVSTTSSASHFTTPLNYTSISALKTALGTANGTYYTTAFLESMTVNDMIFALRNIQDPTTISDYMSASAA